MVAVTRALALSAALCFAQASVAYAQESASARFAEGERAYGTGDFVAAGEAFEAAFATDPQPPSLWNAARSWHRAGELPRAANLYREYLSVAPKEAPDRDAAIASLLELARELGRLEIVAPEAQRIVVDGRPARLGPWYVAPGQHQVEASFEKGTTTWSVAVAKGETQTVVLAPPGPAVKPPPPPPSLPVEPEKDGVSPAWLIPFVSVTGLSGALTIASGIDVLVARDQYLDIPEIERTAAQFEDGKFKQDRTNVLVGVTAGLAAITLGVALISIDWGSGPVIGLGPGGFSTHVRF
jgi:tetratricopeptide (TPR) repeat protein